LSVIGVPFVVQRPKGRSIQEIAPRKYLNLHDMTARSGGNGKAPKKTAPHSSAVAYNERRFGCHPTIPAEAALARSKLRG